MKENAVFAAETKTGHRSFLEIVKNGFGNLLRKQWRPVATERRWPNFGGASAKWGDIKRVPRTI